jgi:predicted SnoaL-like aldol condensation-catalyzing enzyme
MKQHMLKELIMSKTTPEQNKALLVEAFDTLFNKRDYTAAERFWSPKYIQHSSHIEPGRDGLFNLVKSMPTGSKWEHGIAMAEGDYVMIHSRYSNPDGSAIVVVDIMRFREGVFEEHWDVIQPEATKAESKSKLPMFGDRFPS